MTDKSNLDYERQFRLKELELNALLEITRAVNNNSPEESLYMMYKFTLRANLNLHKFALYVLDEYWECKVFFGTHSNFSDVPLEVEKIVSLKEISRCSEMHFQHPAFKEFELIIPIWHKDAQLAFVFLDEKASELANLVDNVDVRFVQTLSNIILVAIENKKLVRRQIDQEAYKKELEIAQRVQSMLFPKSLPSTENLEIKATYFPHDIIGGDYYDYIQVTETQFLLCIADVSGKGIPAALLMSTFQASLRTLSRQTINLKKIIEELNFQTYNNNPNGEHFITAFIALYDSKRKRLQYINAGHNPAVLYVKNNQHQLLETGTTVLGPFHPLPFLQENFIYELDDFLLFAYTDGVTEIRSPYDEEFGIDRLLYFFQRQKQSDLKKIHEKLLEEIDNFRKYSKYIDDITLLSCRVRPVKT